MRTYCKVQGTLFSALWQPKWEGNPVKWGYIYMADSLCHTVETNYTPKSLILKKTLTATTTTTKKNMWAVKWLIQAGNPISNPLTVIQLSHFIHSFMNKIYWLLLWFMGFPGGSAGKESSCNVGDLGLIPGLGRSPGGGKGYPLQYSGLENCMDCIVHGVTKSWTRLFHIDFHFQIEIY